MKFNISIDDGPEQYFTVETSVFRDAAAAVPGVLGRYPPMTVEIWQETFHPRARSFFFRLKENEFGGLVTEHVVRR